MFKNKGVKLIEKRVVVEPKVSNLYVCMVDVNMAITKSKVTEEQVFKDRESIKKKYAIDLKEEQRRPITKSNFEGESTLECKLGKIAKI
jgi:hypothetical protein